MPIQALAIFDIDGTLIDSRAMINASMQAGFRDVGLPAPDYDSTRQIVGLSLEVAIDRLAPRDIGPQVLEKIIDGYKRAFIALRTERAGPEPFYDGAKELVQYLHAQGWALGVATGKSRKGLNAVLDGNGLRDYFGTHFCADDGPGKPHPFMVEANLKALEFRAKNAVIIGDTHFDMSMGKAAGVRAFGVDWGFHTADEIQAGGADRMFSTMADLKTGLVEFKAQINNYMDGHE